MAWGLPFPFILYYLLLQVSYGICCFSFTEFRSSLNSFAFTHGLFAQNYATAILLFQLPFLLLNSVHVALLYSM